MQPAVTLRAARCQLAYWDKGELRIVNVLTREKFSANPVVFEIMRFFASPRTIRDAMIEFDAYTRESVGEVILKLIEAELLLERGSPAAARDDLLESSWRAWLPECGFHFLTKDAPYAGSDLTSRKTAQATPSTPQPPKFKKAAGLRAISLPPHEWEADSFFRTLHERRTRREFSKAPVSLDAVSKLLHVTWGVQGYVESGYCGPLPLKTSPSGGARHPI
jgi:hypothetical protein